MSATAPLLMGDEDIESARHEPHNVFQFIIPGAIRGKGRPRFSRRSGRAYTDDKTQNAEAWVRACAIDAGARPMLGPLEVTISVTTQIPASWSKRRRAEALEGQVSPTGKPDLDNIAKLICDALNGIAWQDDSQIISMTLCKSYGANPSASVEVVTL